MQFFPPFLSTYTGPSKRFTWSRKGQLVVLPHSGTYAMVLDPIIVSKKHSYRLSHVLMGGGSSINLL